MAKLRSDSTVGGYGIVKYIPNTAVGSTTIPVYVDMHGEIQKCSQSLPEISYSNGTLTIKTTTLNE